MALQSKLLINVFKETLRQHLAKSFDSRELDRWFDPLHMDINQEECILRVSFPHSFFHDWFMNTVRDAFESCTANCSDLPLQNFSIVYENPHQTQKNDLSSFIKSTREKATDEKTNTPVFGDLPREHSFDNFLVNRKNDFPVVAAKKFVAHELSPTEKLNFFSPFVIYGQSGSGKSHLLAAMSGALKKNDKSFYHGDISFLEQMIISPGRYARVPEKCVFLDDMQRISACVELQDALVALVDMFQSSGRLLGLAFDAHPASCVGLGQNLRTRLCSGLVVELKRPDLDICHQYVQRQNEFLKLDLSKDQMLNLARRFADLRNIDGALTRLFAYRSLLMQDDAREQPADVANLLTQGLENEALTPSHIIATCARHFSVSPEDIIGKSRDKKITLPRHISISLCRELLAISLVQIGRIFGNRDHSSIIYSINKIKLLKESDKVTNKLVADLRKLCLSRQF